MKKFIKKTPIAIFKDGDFDSYLILDVPIEANPDDELKIIVVKEEIKQSNMTKGLEVEHIVSVAVYYDVIYSLPKPARHGTILNSLLYVPDMNVGPEDQGFLTNTGRFVNRCQAMEIAFVAGQILKDSKNKSPELYSEDLW